MSEILSLQVQVLQQLTENVYINKTNDYLIVIYNCYNELKQNSYYYQALTVHVTYKDT